MWKGLKALFKKEEQNTIQEILNKRARSFKINGLPKRLLIEKEGKQALQGEFLANGTHYVIFSPSDVLNIDTADVLRHLQIAFSTGETVRQIKKGWAEVTKLLSELVLTTDENKKKEAYLNALSIAHSFRDGMFNEKAGTLKHGAALYICTLFILPKGADLTKGWSFEQADKAIEDWKEENIAIHDFFLLAKAFCADSSETTKAYFQE